MKRVEEDVCFGDNDGDGIGDSTFLCLSAF
jgi:hypothetical protein